MLVLVGCEFSGTVRNAFRAKGHEAWSCDLLPDENNDIHHYQCDLFEAVIDKKWDLAIFHPPCTYLCSSGLHWNKRRPGRAEETEKALEFVASILALDIPRVALENPIGCISSRIRKPDQIVQPYWFGEDASKQTCLWLKGLPLLTPTNMIKKPKGERYANQTPSGQNKLGPSETRWMERSRTYKGLADAMAEQWGGQ